MERQELSVKQLAQKMSIGIRTVKRWRSGETLSLRPESAHALEKALGTRGVFTQFIHAEPERGTRAQLEEQIAAYAAEQRRLRGRIEELERRIPNEGDKR